MMNEWGDHIEHIAKKAASGSYAIRSAKRFLSVDNLKSLYFSLVHSHLAYGNMIWGTAYLHRDDDNRGGVGLGCLSKTLYNFIYEKTSVSLFLMCLSPSSLKLILTLIKNP